MRDLLPAGLHSFDLLFERIKAPIARPLAWREILQCHEELARYGLQRYEHERSVNHPVVIGIRVVLGLFEWVTTEIKKQWKT